LYPVQNGTQVRALLSEPNQWVSGVIGNTSASKAEDRRC
jgi:hypothetical protein